MKHTAYIIILVLSAVLAACSTAKNTGGRRAYHEMKVIHNVYFNGQIAYNEGLQAIDKANEDDFSQVISLYPISNPKAQKAATSQMDKSIEKSRKCIKLHSIHAKPKRKANKMRDPKYKAWLQREEFNNQMYRAWLMLGQSEFHKGDFLGSIGTFSYVSKLYSYDKDMVAQCQLWMARAYAEMGWQYEAEDMIAKVKVDDLKRKHQSYYSAVSADLLLKGGHMKEAIPFIKTARKDEKRSLYRPRFDYVLGQLYERQGLREPAREAYKKVLRMQPAPEMMFNARLRYLALAGDTLKTMKSLRQMVKLPKHKDLLDQLYGTMGDLYLLNGDTTQALRCYATAAEKSTRNGKDKAAVLLTAGDLYYGRSQYAEAAPCYKEAVQILSHEDDRYEAAARRSENLESVVKEENTVALQDSLQQLSLLSEEEQKQVAERIVADLIASEKADSVKTAQAAREAERNKGGLGSVDTGRMLGGNKDNSWYFYNSQLLKSGQTEFTRRWGNRALEDDWRRLSKSGSAAPSSLDTSDTAESGEDMPLDSTSVASADSVATKTPVTDTHSPEYYLQQIPKTEEDIAASNAQIADALYNLVGLYRDKLADMPKSDAAYEDFYRRFPQEERVPELLYRQYLAASKDGKDADAERYKQDLVRLFPNTLQAKMVSDPQFLASLQRMEAQQDSLYAATYAAYRKGDYRTVKSNRQVAETEYPMSPLMPRYLFLNAVATARTEGQTPFVADLKDMVQRYPEHELSAMAKKMLALMGEGLESQKGGTPADLQTQREQTTEVADNEDQTEQEYSTERAETAYVLAVIPQNKDTLNQLQFDVAVFNFSQFLIKDFDLQAVPNFTAEQSALQISGFESMDEAEWYMGMLVQDVMVHGMLQAVGGYCIPITQTNYNRIPSLGLEKYLQDIVDKK